MQKEFVAKGTQDVCNAVGECDRAECGLLHLAPPEERKSSPVRAEQAPSSAGAKKGRRRGGRRARERRSRGLATAPRGEEQSTAPHEERPKAAPRRGRRQRTAREPQPSARAEQTAGLQGRRGRRLRRRRVVPGGGASPSGSAAENSRGQSTEASSVPGAQELKDVCRTHDTSSSAPDVSKLEDIDIRGSSETAGGPGQEASAPRASDALELKDGDVRGSCDTPLDGPGREEDPAAAECPDQTTPAGAPPAQEEEQTAQRIGSWMALVAPLLGSWRSI
jgi:hypothetical protein